MPGMPVNMDMDMDMSSKEPLARRTQVVLISVLRYSRITCNLQSVQSQPRAGVGGTGLRLGVPI
jgi:hypothetical protein